MATQTDRSMSVVIDYYDSEPETEPEFLKKDELGNINKERAMNSGRLLFKRKYNEHNDCPVCLGDMFSKVVGFTHCGHVICRDCIVNQLEKANHSSYKYNCPMCRTNLRNVMSGIERYNRLQSIISAQL